MELNPRILSDGVSAMWINKFQNRADFRNNHAISII